VLREEANLVREIDTPQLSQQQRHAAALTLLAVRAAEVRRRESRRTVA
jgi:hypothetical protein